MSETPEQLKCLHLVTRAHEEVLAVCMNQYAAGDTVVFIDAGVMHLLRNLPDTPSGGGSVFCFSDEDLQARGLRKAAHSLGVEVVSDRAVARLLFDHEHCLTWK